MVTNGEKNGEILFFLKNGEMVQNGDLNFKIVFTNTLFVLSSSYQ